MSTTLKTLTGAALAAAITLGGLTSAHAQVLQPFGEPYSEEPAIENVATDESPYRLDGDATQMDGASKDDNQWIPASGITYLYDKHYDWLGVKHGTALFEKCFSWQEVDNIYHKGGKISSGSTNTYYNNLWVTPDTLFGERVNGGLFNTAVVTNFILQVGVRNVYGEDFGVPFVTKPLVLNKKSITYDGKTTSDWGVDKKEGHDTTFSIEAYCAEVSEVTVNGGFLYNNENSIIHTVYLKSGHVYNHRTCVIDLLVVSDNGYSQNGGGYIERLCISGGKLCNIGYIDKVYLDGGEFGNGYWDRENCCPGGTGEVSELTMTGGTLRNYGHIIETLHYYGGTIKYMGNVGQFIDHTKASAGMEEAEFDEGYVDEGFSDNAVMDDADFEDAAVDNAGWQDAVPMGEEVMVW